MAGVTRVRLLDSGTLVIDQSHITWNIGCGTPVRFPVYSVLIEHTDGLFMFDSGYDLDLVNEVLPVRAARADARSRRSPAQLAKCGFEPGDVDAIINSHLHFDHCGGNQHLTNATTYLHREELREARTPEPFERLGYADRGYDHPGAKFSLLEGDVEFAKGMHLFHTPGPYGRALLAAGRAGGQPAAAVHGRRLLHAGRVRGRAAGGLPQQPGRRRALDPPRGSGWRRSGTPRSSTPTTPRPSAATRWPRIRSRAGGGA